VRHEQQGAVVAFQRLLKLLDGRQVKVVGWLVQDKEVHAPRLQQGQGGPGAFTGRQGINGPGRVVRLEAELGQQRADFCRRQVYQDRLDSVRQRKVAGEKPARLVDLADRNGSPHRCAAGLRREVAEQKAEQGGLAGAVGTGNADPLPRVELEIHRAQGETALAHHGVTERGHHRTGAGRLADGELELPFLPGLFHHVQPGNPRFHLPYLLGLLLRGLGAGGPADLVVVRVLLHGVPHTLGTPLALGPRPGHQVGFGGREILIFLACVPPCNGAFLQEGVVAAVVNRDRILRQVQLHHGGDAAGQEFPVVADQHDAAAQAADKILQFCQAGQVQVIRGLVQEYNVEPAQQQGRERHPRRLAAGQPGHFGVRTRLKAQLGQDSRDALIQVRGP
jgi:hypothetical protein